MNRSEGAMTAVGVALILALVLTVGCMRWRECRRVHPFWYCAMSR